MAEEISARIVHPEVKSAFIGFSVDGNLIQFVDGEGGAERAIRAKHQADMMQLYGQMANLVPDAIADISSGWRQEGIFEFGAVSMRGLE